jgi:hypothetical protein
VRFAFWTNEEPPFFQTELMGSVVYDRRCHERREQIAGALSLETLGYDTDTPGTQTPAVMVTDTAVSIQALPPPAGHARPARVRAARARRRGTRARRPRCGAVTASVETTASAV